MSPAVVLSVGSRSGGWSEARGILRRHGKDRGSRAGEGSSAGYPGDWKDRFLNPDLVTLEGTDVVYRQGVNAGFYLIDIWTDTWRDIAQSQLTDPTDNSTFNFPKVNTLLDTNYGQDNTRPGYSSAQSRYTFMQSRRVFRYQKILY